MSNARETTTTTTATSFVAGLQVRLHFHPQAPPPPRRDSRPPHEMINRTANLSSLSLVWTFTWIKRKHVVVVAVVVVVLLVRDLLNIFGIRWTQTAKVIYINKLDVLDVSLAIVVVVVQTLRLPVDGDHCERQPDDRQNDQSTRVIYRWRTNNGTAGRLIDDKTGELSVCVFGGTNAFCAKIERLKPQRRPPPPPPRRN